MNNYTDEELLAAANKGLYSLLSQKIKTTTITMLDCRAIQRENIKSFIQSRKPHYWERLTKSEKTLVEHEIDRLFEDLNKTGEAILLRVQKDNTVQKINASSTEAIVRSFFEDHGIPLKYIWMQKYRAKVAINLEKDKFIILHIKYKSVFEDLENVPQTIADANKMISLFGRDLRIL